MRGLKGKNVLVTGGSSGIGQAIAIRFSEYGSNITINYYRSLEEAEQTEQALQLCREQVRQQNVKDTLIQADVSQEADVVRMVKQTVEDLGGLDILINNAGFQIPDDSHDAELQGVERVLATNLVGAYVCAREAIKHFLATNKPGVIINVSSVHQIIPKPRFISYSMSKGGMQNMTRTLALEYARNGIRVNAIGPGATITPINRAWVDDPEKRAEVEQHIPMGRAAEADEMGAAAAFLASDDAAYITGQTLFVDGGLTLYPDFRTAWSSE